MPWSNSPSWHDGGQVCIIAWCSPILHEIKRIKVDLPFIYGRVLVPRRVAIPQHVGSFYKGVSPTDGDSRRVISWSAILEKYFGKINLITSFACCFFEVIHSNCFMDKDKSLHTCTFKIDTHSGAPQFVQWGHAPRPAPPPFLGHCTGGMFNYNPCGAYTVG